MGSLEAGEELASSEKGGSVRSVPEGGLQGPAGEGLLETQEGRVCFCRRCIPSLWNGTSSLINAYLLNALDE